MPTPRKSSTFDRVMAVVVFVGTLAWLSVVIGIGIISIVGSPWCVPGSECAGSFWPRLLLAAVGGAIAFFLAGYGLLNFWHRRPLLRYGLGALAVVALTGAPFAPVLLG